MRSVLVEQMHRVSGFSLFVLAGMLDVYFRHWLFAWIHSTGLRSGRSSFDLCSHRGRVGLGLASLNAGTRGGAVATFWHWCPHSWIAKPGVA